MEAPASIWCGPRSRGGQSRLPHRPCCRLSHSRSQLELLCLTAALAGVSAVPSPHLSHRGAGASTRWHTSETGESGGPPRKTTPSDVQRPGAWRCTQLPECWSRGAASQDQSAPVSSWLWDRWVARSSIREMCESFCTEMGHTSPATGKRLPYLAHTGADTASELRTAHGRSRSCCPPHRHAARWSL